MRIERLVCFGFILLCKPNHTKIHFTLQYGTAVTALHEATLYLPRTQTKITTIEACMKDVILEQPFTTSIQREIGTLSLTRKPVTSYD